MTLAANPAPDGANEKRRRQEEEGAAAERRPREEGGAAYGCGKAREEERPSPLTTGQGGGEPVVSVCRNRGGYEGAATPREEEGGRR